MAGLAAAVAGAPPPVAGRLGLSMTLLQFAIGALNDVVDAPRDALGRPGKPIPAGLVGRGTALGVAAASAAGGLALAAASGAGVAALAVAGLAIGAAYDLRARGTALSWLPLAVGVPLLPVYGWYGATGTLPAPFLVLVPAAAIAGASLAISNALADLERDTAAGTGSVAVALGARPAAVLVVVLQAAVVAIAVGAAAWAGAPAIRALAVAGAGVVPLGAAAMGLAAANGSPRRRQLAWEVLAVGDALLAAAWLGAMADAGWR